MYLEILYFLNFTFFYQIHTFNNIYIYSCQEGHAARKPDLVACEQQWPRPGCAFMQSDPRRCYSLNTKYIISKYHKKL